MPMQVARLALLLPYVWYIVADSAHPLAIPRRDALAEAFVAGMVWTWADLGYSGLGWHDAAALA